MQKTIFILLFLLIGSLSHAQNASIFGKWKTIDDNSGKARSVVEIYEKDGKAYGRIVELFREPGEEQDPVCNECDEDDDRYMQPVEGLQIIRGLKADNSGNWKNGDILDPENGKVYDCKIWVEDEKLRVRGYLLFLYRTQTWEPYE